MTPKHDVVVCPIAYNELTKLESAIQRFLNSPVRHAVDYVVIDDGSTDGTTSMINSFKQEGISAVRHDTRRGVGAAIRTAIHFAKKAGYRTIVIMAGNDKDDPQEIPLVLAPLEEGYEVVQGSRYLGGARIGGDMPLYRKWATRFHPFLMSLLTGTKVTDSTNGFRAMRLSMFDDPRINIDQNWLDAYELEPYILYKAIILGHRFKEVPVTKIYPPRELGYTKMKPISGWWSILRPLVLLGLRIRR
ncbi:MAG TPA: glycosyltransferase family 2 protein [Candidatus Omnitrophota bacterium]|jgi:dolichol-phosphate mannosyltransferase|nr:glycosyltransferase family 2 protein [Candidatus Omnitrophota bacterium]